MVNKAFIIWPQFFFQAFHLTSLITPCNSTPRHPNCQWFRNILYSPPSPPPLPWVWICYSLCLENISLSPLFSKLLEKSCFTHTLLLATFEQFSICTCHRVVSVFFYLALPFMEHKFFNNGDFIVLCNPSLQHETWTYGYYRCNSNRYIAKE